MTPHTFAMTLVFGSALVAFWLGTRFPSAGPSTLVYAVLNLLCGFATVRAIPALTDVVTSVSADFARLFVPFGIGLPLLTYAFLTGLWMMRVIHRSLTGFPS